MLHDPVQAVRHAQQLRLPVGVLAFSGLTLALFGIAFGPDDDAAGDDINRAVEVVLIDSIAEDTVLL